jgi:hypothetical protein
MNGRFTSSQEFGTKLEVIGTGNYPIPYLTFKLPTNSGEFPPSLDIKFRKYKICDTNGNIREAWFLSTDTFPIN